MILNFFLVKTIMIIIIIIIIIMIIIITIRQISSLHEHNY